MARLKAPTECANCGATIPPAALACPECGADERTGWRETSFYDGLDLTEDDALSQSPGSRQHPEHARPVNGIAWYWWCMAVVFLLFLGLRLLGLD
jgi:hypothetical protein